MVQATLKKQKQKTNEITNEANTKCPFKFFEVGA